MLKPRGGTPRIRPEYLKTFINTLHLSIEEGDAEAIIQTVQNLKTQPDIQEQPKPPQQKQGPLFVGGNFLIESTKKTTHQPLNPPQKRKRKKPKVKRKIKF